MKNKKNSDRPIIKKLNEKKALKGVGTMSPGAEKNCMHL